jgi:hypothetical protein
MVPVNRHADRSHAYTLLWVLVLGAPVSWSAAFGALYSLTNELCIQETSRTLLAGVALGCVLLGAIPGLVAWQWRRHLEPQTEGQERARFMLELATGGSVIVTLLSILMAFPVFLLDPCRI